MELLVRTYEGAFEQVKRVYEYEYCGYEWVYIGPDGNYYVGKHPTNDYRQWANVAYVLYNLKHFSNVRGDY